MATQYRRRSLGFLMAAVVLGVPASAALSQEVLEMAKRPLGEEAYQLLTLFYEYDRDIPLEARVFEKQDLPNCTREKIVFRVRDSWVVAYLGIPKTGSPPYPCVLELHGLTGSKASWWEDDNFTSGGNMTKALLSAGVAVFTPDAQYHGERISSNGFESAGVMVFQKRWTSREREMLVQTTIECRRAIDYLETRSEIDKSRVGVVGYGKSSWPVNGKWSSISGIRVNRLPHHKLAISRNRYPNGRDRRFPQPRSRTLSVPTVVGPCLALGWPLPLWGVERN